MAFQYSTTVRNAKLDAVESVIGVSAILKVFSGAEPVNAAAPDPAGLLATINLPSDWMAPAGGGSKVKLGTWSAAATGSGIAASWRLYDSGGITCHVQGNVADMTFDNLNLSPGQTLTVTGFTLISGNG